MVLAGQRRGQVLSEPSLQTALDAIKTYLSQFKNNIRNEFFAVGLPDGETRLHVLYSDIDWFDELVELIQTCRSPGGEWYVLPVTNIDAQEFYLVDAKRPNEKGEVPTGGAY